MRVPEVWEGNRHTRAVRCKSSDGSCVVMTELGEEVPQRFVVRSFSWPSGFGDCVRACPLAWPCLWAGSGGPGGTGVSQASEALASKHRGNAKLSGEGWRKGLRRRTSTFALPTWRSSNWSCRLLGRGSGGKLRHPGRQRSRISSCRWAHTLRPRAS